MAALRSGASMALALLSLIAPVSGREPLRTHVPQSSQAAFQFPERLEGDFTQVAEMPLDGGGKETTTITGHVVWQIKSADSVDQPGNSARAYEATMVKLNVRVSGSASDSHIGTCQHDGSVQATPTAAQRGQMTLRIDSAGQATIQLALVDRDVTYDVKYSCKGPIKVPPANDRRYGVTVLLGGPYVTALNDGKLIGATTQPIRIGPQTITGSWKFAAAGGGREDR